MARLQDEISFHPDAIKKCEELKGELLRTVQDFGPLEPPPPPLIELHPAAHIRQGDVIAPPKFMTILDALGEQRGFWWPSQNRRVGWDGDSFKNAIRMSEILAGSKGIKTMVSSGFILSEVCTWLIEVLERNRSDHVSDYISQRCREEIDDYEIWYPLFRTFASSDFKIGDVHFRTITKSLMEEWWNRIPAHLTEDNPAAVSGFNQHRSKLQGSRHHDTIEWPESG